MKGLSLVVGLSAFLLGCAAPVQQAKIKLNTSFDKQEAERLMASGNNAIKGSALIRQMGGGVVTCAGQEVRVWPATVYATERVSYLYGSDTAGMRSAYVVQNNPNPFDSTPEDYQKYSKATLCDAQGFFKFEKLADGEFFVVSSITWKSNPKSMFFDGGLIMRKVKVSGGEVKEIVIAP